MMRAIFSYRKWSSYLPDRDTVPDFMYEDRNPVHRIICPVPTCLKEWEEPNAVGRIAIMENSREITALAEPCSLHQDTFDPSPGWYQPFIEAVYARDEKLNGPAQPRTCIRCGDSYTSFLFGCPFTDSLREDETIYPTECCPECSYREMRWRKMTSFRKMRERTTLLAFMNEYSFLLGDDHSTEAADRFDQLMGFCP